MIIGHERQCTYLEDAHRRGRMPHAYLFYGPEHIGKFTVAKEYAARFQEIEVIAPEPGKELSIAAIRELKRVCAFAPRANQERLFIIDEAQRLTREAGNAFLKLLEEPGKHTVFILVTPALDMILPTIISRACPLRFSLVQERALDDFLVREKIDAPRRDELRAFARGRPGILIRLISDKEYFERETQLKKEVTGILTRRAYPEAFLLAQRTASDDDLRRRAIEYTISLVRDACRTGDGLQKKNKVRALKEIHRIMASIETTNVNPRLAMDALFIEALKTT